MNIPATWPTDADGDVFRRLEASNFDFTADYAIDFNVDFDDWPPHPEAIAWLQEQFQDVEVYKSEGDLIGYIQFKIYSKLSYTLVINTQAEVTTQMRKHGGVCETWGVMQSEA